MKKRTVKEGMKDEGKGMEGRKEGRKEGRNKGKNDDLGGMDEGSDGRK